MSEYIFNLEPYLNNIGGLFKACIIEINTCAISLYIKNISSGKPVFDNIYVPFEIFSVLS